VTVNGDGTGLVSQNGGGNTANMLITGLGSTGSIYQNGDGNNIGTGTLTEHGLKVEGKNASGSITQNGDGNTTSLAVFGNGTSVDYTVNGDNFTNVPAGGVQVISNGATVTITQTRF
jgi:hypothetical protein